MAEKRSSPLNNPPPEKLSSSSSKFSKSSYDDDDDKGRGRGVSKGGKGRVKPAEALLKCLMCGRVQKVVFAYGRPPEWHRCIWCGEMQPTDGYRQVGYGLNIPQPLAPHKLKARQLELERQKGVQS